jgi:dihydrofolate reductase
MAVVSLIAAHAHNRVIGKDNALPWRLPEDLRHFKSLTLGHPIIMGRKTWESLGRPLPGRENIVISRQANYAAAGAEVVGSIADALATVATSAEVFIIGGAEIYRQSLALADQLYLTEIDLTVDGDAFFPDYPRHEWREASRQRGVSESGLRYAFIRLDRVTPPPQATQST